MWAARGLGEAPHSPPRGLLGGPWLIFIIIIFNDPKNPGTFTKQPSGLGTPGPPLTSHSFCATSGIFCVSRDFPPGCPCGGT